MLKPLVVATVRRSIDSSTWKVPAVPSAQELWMVLGRFGSAPPTMLSLPKSSDGPESHDINVKAHSGTPSVVSYAARPARIQHIGLVGRRVDSQRTGVIPNVDRGRVV